MILKNKKFIFNLIIMLVLIETCTLFLMYKSFSNNQTEDIVSNKKNIKSKNFAVMLEQSDGTYIESNMNKWPSEGYIYSKTKSGCIDINGNKLDGILTYDEDKNIAIIETTTTSFCYLYFDIDTSICTYDTSSAVAEGLEGAKYNCKVDPNKPEYTFYLLDTNEDGTSDLIMNANINASGEKVIPGVTEDTGTVSWCADEQSSIHGPITAMEYLHNATKSWTNVEPLTYTYNDREVQGVTTTDKGYQSFVSTNGVAIITKGDSAGTQVSIGSSSEPLRARMPIRSSDASITEVTSKTNASYLYENFDSNYEYSGPYGYWTLSSFTVDSYSAWYVRCNGKLNFDDVDNAGSNGVRPVITLKI